MTREHPKSRPDFTAPPPASLDPSTIEAITFDFGNTLVRFSAGQLRATLGACAVRVARDLRGVEADAFVRVWQEERDRQIREDVPEGREADIDVRAARVLARLRGAATPAAGGRWDDAALAAAGDMAQVRICLEAYVAAFLETTPVPADVGPMLERLAKRHRLAVLSNWPLTAAILRYLEAAGWARYLDAVVVSHEVGCIKPAPAIFAEAARRLGVASGPAILHVGHDPGADVAGAHRAGWRAAWVASRPADSPLPLAEVAGDVAPDLVLGDVRDLEPALGYATAG